MQPLPHQVMGYDRAITMFSPDGRLLQVEYARKTVRMGNTAIGIVCKEGVLLVTDKRILGKLVVPEAVEKIFQIDDHIIGTASGIISDARVLMERAQVKAQQHRVMYTTPIDVLSIVKDLANLKQYTTQSGGLRPFGVALLIAGVDQSGVKLFSTDPFGSFNQYKATVIGEGDTEIEEMLQTDYKDNMTIDEGLKLALKAIKSVLKESFNVDRIDAAYVQKDEVLIKRIDKEKIKKLLK